MCRSNDKLPACRNWALMNEFGSSKLAACRYVSKESRMRRHIANCLSALCLVACCAGIAAAQENKDAKAPQAIQPAEVKLGRPVDFERDVYPILDAKCVACHNVAINENGLNLEDVKGILKGGKRGPSVIAKDPEKSLLYK